MNIAAARRQQRAFDSAQSAWDAMTPEDEGCDCDGECHYIEDAEAAEEERGEALYEAMKDRQREI